MSFFEDKKLYVVLGGIIFVIFLLLIYQFYLVNVITVQQEQESIVSNVAYPIPYSQKDPSFGNPGAPIIVTIFADAGCEKCMAPVNEVREYVRAFPRDVRLVWKDAPKNSLFHDSVLPHKALRCAANQDKFWPYLDKIFGTSDVYDQKFLEETARATGLNMPTWTTCLTLKETTQAINDNAALSEALDIGTLPAVFINNKQIRLLKGIDLIQILKQVNVKQ